MVTGHAGGLVEPGALFALCVELVAAHDALEQLELPPKERLGRPLWEMLDAYAVNVLGKAPRAPKAPKPAKKAAPPKPAAKKAPAKKR